MALWFAIAIQAGKQGVGRGSRSGREPLYRDKTAALAVSDVYRAAPPSPSPKSQGHKSGTASRERCELRASNGPGPAQGIDGWARLALDSTALLGFPSSVWDQVLRRQHLAADELRPWCWCHNKLPRRARRAGLRTDTYAAYCVRIQPWGRRGRTIGWEVGS